MNKRSALYGSIKNPPTSIFERQRSTNISKSSLTWGTEVPPAHENEIVSALNENEQKVEFLKKKKKKRLPGMSLIKGFISSQKNDKSNIMDSKVEIDPSLLIESRGPLIPIITSPVRKPRRKTQRGSGILDIDGEKAGHMIAEIAECIGRVVFRGTSKTMPRSKAALTKKAFMTALMDQIKEIAIPAAIEQLKDYTKTISNRVTRFLGFEDADDADNKLGISNKLSQGLTRIFSKVGSGRLQIGSGGLKRAMRSLANRSLKQAGGFSHLH